MLIRNGDLFVCDSAVGSGPAQQISIIRDSTCRAEITSMKWLSFSVDGNVLENFTKNHFSSISENIYEFKSSVKCFYSF